MKPSLLLAAAGDVLSPAEVQQVLGIGRNATYELLASGKLPSIRITPRRIVVTKRALEAFLQLTPGDSVTMIPGERRHRESQK
jgi:excisionase family DNA binding protein